jgi:cyclic beta-1,2-glucan synthetase
MYRVALESILGVTLEGGTTLCVKPRIPDGWPGFSVRLRIGSGATSYAVEIVNECHGAGGATAVSVDGEPGVVLEGVARIALRDDGATHRVRVTLATAS